MMKTKAYLATFLIAIAAGSPDVDASNWLEVDGPTPTDATAHFIYSNYGGSGLGVTVWGTYDVKIPAEGTATSCCDGRCFCGSVLKMISQEITATMYIAKLQEAYTLNGQVGEIANITRLEVTQHEFRHVEIRHSLSLVFNPHVAAEYPTITTGQYSSSDSAKDKAKHTAQLFDSACKVEFGPLANTHNIKLDQIEGAGVSGEGVWRVGASPSYQSEIIDKIEEYEPSAAPGEPSSGDCS